MVKLTVLFVFFKFGGLKGPESSLEKGMRRDTPSKNKKSVARERGRLLANCCCGSGLVNVFRGDILRGKMFVGPQNGDDFFKIVALNRVW